ncbi:c-type cytochrome [Tropicibacter naphthalenivorans]|uniref:Cytochrome c552 n=1 Tax=Tropicibacter naphthalenivorans TaxID=441103 RepID=A0A0P1GQN1_9RHOB|nr:cytochrome c family protein [Tropicibacter naphthalenivorans]CUH77883.1 Cytochrome c552 [Tropicibacter naphthalenivorans]SMC95299.1 cytochrome c [Tropicibacter naphthalenivorans]
MFDTMTLTKAVGGVCGTFLVFLLAKWTAETLYHTEVGGHGEEVHAAYVIEVDDGGAAAEPEEEIDFATMMASADAAKGEKVFGKCRACHAIDGTDKTGPHLNGVVDRAIGSVAGFGYSGALNQVGDVWTAENLNTFLENPRGSASGTTMSFSGLNKPADRVNLIAYLATLGG